MTTRDRTLGIICTVPASQYDGALYLHLSFGRVIDRLAPHFAKCYLCAPVAARKPLDCHDYRIAAANVEVIPQPAYRSSLAALRGVLPITRSYARVCRQADVLFVRGMVPYVANLYALAAWRRKRPCHWIVGNPVALLRTHERAGRLVDAASLVYAWQDRFFTRLGRWLTGGAYLCNGGELGAIYRSPRTHVTVSSTVTDDEFFLRDDTCQQESVQLLFVGFLRPEKGLQYLIEALSLLRTRRRVELLIVGAADEFRGYRQQLEALAKQLGVAGRIRWEGYVVYGPEMFAYLRAADVLVLPTLSEGTPRVLLEARANSLPVIATRVGGIPTSVTDGLDGLLVPPKDAPALAAAIDRVIDDAQLRGAIIQNGLTTARRYTVDRFVELALRVLEE